MSTIKSPTGHRKKGQKPRFIMCYICGREFGAQSLPIHQPQCAEKWKKREALKPRSERKPLPKPPQLDNRALNVNSEQALDAFNEQMRKKHEEEVQIRCPHCDRTFNDTAFKHHQKSCTAERPAKRLIRKTHTSVSSPSSRSSPKPTSTAPRKSPMARSSGGRDQGRETKFSSSSSSSSSSSRAKQNSSTGQHCAQCGDAGREGDRFCSKCGGHMEADKKAAPVCSFCEDEVSVVDCGDCGCVYCATCDAQAHKAKSKQSHRRQQL